MIRFLLFALVVLIGVAVPAHADVRDVAVGVAGDRADIRIVFDGVPTSVSAAPDADGVVVHVAGLSARARTIETAGSGPLSAVTFVASEGGVDVHLQLRAEAVAARAFVEGRELRIAVQFVSPWMGAESAPRTNVSANPSVSPSTNPGQNQVAHNSTPARSQVAAPSTAHASDVDASAEHAADPSEPAHDSSPETAAPTVAEPEAAEVAHVVNAAEPPAATPEAAPEAFPQASPEAAPENTVVAAHEPSLGSSVDYPDVSGPGADHADDVQEAEHPAAVGVSEPSGHEPSTVLGAQVSARPGVPNPADDAGAPPQSAWMFDRNDRSRPVVVAGGGLDYTACENAEETVRSDPWNLEALSRYASCLALRGELLGAAVTFRRLLTFEPDNVGAEIGLAATQQELGETAFAVEVYQRLLPDMVGDAQAARVRALLALAGAPAVEPDAQGHH